MQERKPLTTINCQLQTSTDITSSLQEIFGGNAVSDEYHIGRHVANLFVTQTYEGQSDIHSKQTVFCAASGD
jgi:alkylation response protein AidB-like acyl-CoA dehydrogenase